MSKNYKITYFFKKAVAQESVNVEEVSHTIQVEDTEENIGDNKENLTSEIDTKTLLDVDDEDEKLNLKRLKPVIGDSDEDDKLTFKRLKPVIGDSDEETEAEFPAKRKKSEMESKNKAVISNGKSFLNNKPEKKLSDSNQTNNLSKFHNKKYETKVENESSFVEVDKENDKFIHLTFNFLKPESIRDRYGKRPDHPDYDSKSLKIPNDFMQKLTPAMKQWWKIKADGNMDKILFFKVGKFYETYHMDAVITVNELNLTFMRGNYAHSGFPEIAFTKMTDQLVLKGYNVARVEQTESVSEMNARVKDDKIKDKVVVREVCQVITPGTRSFSLRNETCKKLTLDNHNGGDNCDYTFVDNSVDILLAFKESPREKVDLVKDIYFVDIGIAFVDCATGKFVLSQFPDDNQRSRFKTFLSRFPPTEIIYEKGNLSKNSQFIFNTSLSSIKKESLLRESQFYSSEETLKLLLDSNYFIDTPATKMSKFGLPNGLTPTLNENDNLGRTAGSDYTLAVSSLGALLYYLKQCLIDNYLFSFGEFEIFNPRDVSAHDNLQSQQFMILDSTSMKNLDLLRNNSTGGTEGTLLERLDFTSTPFGRRQLVQWISCPLYDPVKIAERQRAIGNLINIETHMVEVKSKLKSLPDLEKLLAKIHVLGVHRSVKDHPNSRAVLYELVTYSKRKISDFISTLNGFRCLAEIQTMLANLVTANYVKNELIKKLVLLSTEGGTFPNLKDAINYFREAFDHEQAKVEGKIIPESGVDAEYDDAIEKIADINKELQDYLNKLKNQFNCSVSYFGTAKNRYQIEIPQAHCHKIPDNFVPTSQRKNFKRYQSPTTERLLSDMMSAEDKRDVALKNIMCKIFSKFDEYHYLWSKAVENIMQLDVLISLSIFSKGLDGSNMVTPKVTINSNGSPFLLIDEGRYPCRAKIDTGEFIPNTVKLGIDENKTVMLLTGPNMGGKSTLMRQVALTVILAQMGCNVPAENEVTLSPVDKLLTRQGASDAISYGQSTLQVELIETSHILSSMTSHSLLLIDELGRGTATHDGCALAVSILHKIASSTYKYSPRTIFSTHFHKLLEEPDLINKLQISHMACVVEDVEEENGNNSITALQNITFLYKLTKGGCPKSYGFNAAKLANVPEKIILKGLEKARMFEEETLINEFKRVLKREYLDIDTFQHWLKKLRSVIY